MDNAFLNAWEKGQYHHVGVQKVVGLHGTGGVRLPDEMFVVADVDAGFGQCGIVE